MLILGISGSLRRDSHNTRLLRAAVQSLPPGTRFAEFNELRAIPAFDEDREDRPAAVVRRLRSAIALVDGVLISTPEYNNSIPGQLKNALDWVSRPFETNPLRAKPVAVLGASTGLFGAVWAQADLRRVLERIGADVLDEELNVGQAEAAFDLRGDLADPASDAALRELVGALARAARGADRAALAA